MILLLVVLVLFLAAGAAALLGWTADSRDPAYGLGPVTHRARGAQNRPTGR